MSEWERLWDEPGVCPDVRSAVGQFGAGLDQFGVMSIQIVVARDDVRDELVGLTLHPERDGVVVGALPNTPAGDTPEVKLTAIFRELGWRWATLEEVAELDNGYLIPELPGRPPRPMAGDARGAALTGLTWQLT